MPNGTWEKGFINSLWNQRSGLNWVQPLKYSSLQPRAWLFIISTVYKWSNRERLITNWLGATKWISLLMEKKKYMQQQRRGSFLRRCRVILWRLVQTQKRSQLPQKIIGKFEKSFWNITPKYFCLNPTAVQACMVFSLREFLVWIPHPLSRD